MQRIELLAVLCTEDQTRPSDNAMLWRTWLVTSKKNRREGEQERGLCRRADSVNLKFLQARPNVGLIGTSEVLNNSWTARMKEICNWTNLNLSQKAIRRNIENGRDSSSIIVHLNILTAKEIVNKNWGWINRLPISPATSSGKVNSICKVQWVGKLLTQ